MKYRPRLPGGNSNVTPTSPLRDLALMLGGMVFIFVTVYFALGMAVDFMVPRISPETEKALGEFLKTKWSGPDEYPEQEKILQNLLDELQEKCGQQLPYTLEVNVAQSEMINALALPGGRILLLTGLLEKVRSENELVFVLAHEMGHFANRDHLSELGRGLVFMAMSVGIFGPNSAISKQVGKLLKVSEMHFSRKHESMADSYALGIQHCFYGHIGGATDFFQHTEHLEKNRFAGHYLSTHPESRKRIIALNELARERGYGEQSEKVGFSMVFPEIKQQPNED